MKEKKTNLYSEIGKRVKACLKNRGNSRNRLAAQGVIVIFSLLVLSFSVQADDGNWRVRDLVNPINNTKITIMSLSAESGKSKEGVVPDLVIRCIGNKIDFYINWNDFLSASNIDVLTKIGDEKAETMKWRPSTCKEKSFYLGSPVKFVERMLEENKFLAQVTPQGESQITAVFNTSGIKNVIKPLQENCGWK
ncbi:MAG: hypothetical protein KAI76_06130 [Alphaproteobacteria bacterium]|nr:hypothetical protein [Alphaproteobacteria bacterium]